MARHVLRHDAPIRTTRAPVALVAAHQVGVARPVWAEVAMTTILLLVAALFVLAFIGGACRIGTGDGEGGE